MNQKQAIPEAGTLDPTFGRNGVVGWPIKDQNSNYPEALLALDDGKLLVVESRPSKSKAVLRRLNTDGTLDKKFGVGGSVEIHFEVGDSFTIPMLSSHPAGGWILTGQLIRPIDEFVGYGYEAVVRLLANGKLDPAFGDNGILYLDTQKLAVPDKHALGKRLLNPKPRQQPTGNAGSATRSSVVLPDGKIVVIDNVRDSDGVRRGMVVRLNSDSSLDSSFNGEGFTLIKLDRIEHKYNAVRALVVQEDGKILVTGTFEPSKDRETYGIYVTRYLENGQLDSEFADQGIATISLTAGPGLSSVEAVEVRKRDGAIAIAGELSREYIRKGWIAVLNASGSVNLVFNGGKTLYSDMLREGVSWTHCEWQESDALLVSGSGGGAFVGQNLSMLIARYLADGAPDTSFNKTGWAVYRTGEPVTLGCVILKNQRIAMCGATTSPTDYMGYILRYYG
jgi:uncharacterized delta-60 repeat protein